MANIPLCVSFSKKALAKRAGARWDSLGKLWFCDNNLLTTPAYQGLKPFVPRMYRPDLEAPYICPWMVPQTLWGKNLRAILPKEQWDIVRRYAYAEAGMRCRVCGGCGQEWPVEADEAWEYDDDRLLHTLRGVIALWPDCHHIRHWGKSLIDGREEEVIAKMITVNGWTRRQVQGAADTAYADWERRSRQTWTSDYSWVTRKHGFAIGADAHTLAQAANSALVAKAARRASVDWYDNDGMSDPDIWLEAPTPFPDHSARNSQKKRSWIENMKRWFGAK